MPKKKKSSKERDDSKSPHPLRQSHGPEEIENQGNSNNTTRNDEPGEAEEDDEDDTMGILQPASGAGRSVGNETDVERERMKLLISHFDQEQMNRYEAFRRANVNRTSVKKLANAVLNQSITANVAVALSGASKVFVGEIMEKAREVQQRMDPPATPEEADKARPIKPQHLREAWRLYKLETGNVPQAHWRRQGGDGDGMMFR